MKEVFLSDIELYFSDSIKENQIIITGDEAYHIQKVMRHTVGDIIYATDGKGKIYQTKISLIKKDIISLDIINNYLYFNNFENIFFCIPILKNSDRFEFAIEKLVELGITNIIIYNAVQSVKQKVNAERVNKIVKQALKQSLRAFLPNIDYKKDLSFINQDYNNIAIILDQNSNNFITDMVFDSRKNYFFIFGPEGGIDNKDINQLKNIQKYKIAKNRLRAETAIISTATIINTIIDYE